MKENAQRVGAALAAMPKMTSSAADRRAQTLFNCALDMGFTIDQATQVLMEAMETPQVP